jgi:hypothetical protein
LESFPDEFDFSGADVGRGEIDSVFVHFKIELDSI